MKFTSDKPNVRTAVKASPKLLKELFKGNRSMFRYYLKTGLLQRLKFSFPVEDMKRFFNNLPETDFTENKSLELNDKILVFDKYTYTDDLYHLKEIKETWNNGNIKDTLILEDSGINLGDFIWDRNGHLSGVNDLQYDIGLVWDQDLKLNATLGDETNYSYTKSIGVA